MTSGGDFAYAGSELELFARATNWKSYLSSLIRPHLGKSVLEVGAGLGVTTRYLCDKQERWLCLEPDEQQAQVTRAAIGRGELPACCEARVGTIADLDAEKFDSILYIDVLEHIEDDQAELARAIELLEPGGVLIALVPAYQWLFTPFDRAIGHYRRYTKRSLAEAVPNSLRRLSLHYLDSVGLLACLGNRFVLRSSLPTARQIWIWDRLMVTSSRLLDPLLGYTIGKSVLGVWRKG